jgi:hypothetical protein
LVKPGRFLRLTVPDEDLREQVIGRFNSDRKATFRFRKSDFWNPASHEVGSMISSLPGSRIVAAEL